MTGDEARRRLSEIQTGEYRKLAALARQIRDESRKPVSTLAGAWASGTASDQRKAETVLTALGELTVESWLSTGRSMTGQRKTRCVMQAGLAYLSAAEHVFQKLNRLMESKAPVPGVPLAGRTEEKELSSRECDEAYLLARRLLKADEPEWIHPVIRKEFLLMPVAKRDTEIANYRKTGRWTPLATTEAAGVPEGEP